MNRETQSLFLAHRAYRQRRVVDAARILPIFGAVLLCLPLLWSLPDDGVVSTTYVIRFLFLAWLGLIVLAAVVSHRLPDPSADTDSPEKPPQQDT